MNPELKPRSSSSSLPPHSTPPPEKPPRLLRPVPLRPPLSAHILRLRGEIDAVADSGRAPGSQPLGGGRRGRWGKREALAFSPQLTLFGLRKSESFVNEL